MIDLQFDEDLRRLTITDVDEAGDGPCIDMSLACWSSLVAEVSERLGHWPASWDSQIRDAIAWLHKAEGACVVLSATQDGQLEVSRAAPPLPGAGVEIENLRTLCSRAESERDLLASQLDMYTSALENLLRAIGDATGIRGDADAVSKSLLEASAKARLAGLRPGSATATDAPTNPSPRLFEFCTGDEVDVDRYLALSLQGEIAHFQLKAGYLRVRFASAEQMQAEIERMRLFRDRSAEIGLIEVKTEGSDPDPDRIFGGFQSRMREIAVRRLQAYGPLGASMVSEQMIQASRVPVADLKRGTPAMLGSIGCFIDGIEVEDHDGDFVTYITLRFASDEDKRAAQLAAAGGEHRLEDDGGRVRVDADAVMVRRRAED